VVPFLFAPACGTNSTGDGDRKETACSSQHREDRERTSKIKIEELLGDSKVIRKRVEKTVNNQKMGVLEENFENGVGGDTDNDVFIRLLSF
jgi:hypothetical protein